MLDMAREHVNLMSVAEHREGLDDQEGGENSLKHRLVSVTEDSAQGRSEKGTEPHLYYQYRQVYYESYEPSCLQRCSNRIIHALETIFYRLGFTVASYPYLTILISLLLCGVCGIGLMRFEQTTDDAKLWVPKSSRVLPEKAWMDKHFPKKYRFTSFIVTAHNILTPKTVNAMYDMYLQSRMMIMPGLKHLDLICLKVGSMCNIQGLLELWQYNGTVIRSLSVKDILNAVNAHVKYSPMFGTELSLENILGGIRRDKHGAIVGAASATLLWVLHNEPQFKEAALDWEEQMIKMANADRPFILRTYVYATRTFDDEGYGAVQADTSLLTAGFIIVFIFIIMVLGRFNCVENKLYVSLSGILTIGLSILFCYGIAMACGFLYGPIHNLMPFLLLGIGVDDMFVIVRAWENLSSEEGKLPIAQKMAMTLKHAGVSITVTSVTDIVAFGIGGSTVIPALSAFCAYAALGILGLYLLVSTFFVAILTLDERRISDNRNAVIFCYKHKNYVPNKCSQVSLVETLIKKLYAPTLLKLPSKIAVMIVTAVLVGVNTWSFTMLQQDFDLYDYLPTDSYATDYIHAQKTLYPDRGYDASIFCDGMDYFSNAHHLERMYEDLQVDPYVQNGSLHFWYPAFTSYLHNTNDSFVTSLVGNAERAHSSKDFSTLLLYFLQQSEGRSYGQYIKLDNSTPPTIQATYIPFVHVRQSSSAGDIAAMESVREILDNVPLTDGRCFAYGFKYLNNETNKVLKGELYRNLALAGLCVFIVTLLLIANLWTSILVFSCVAFTVVDVTGTLQFWDVTIDTASSILITLCVGLAVDYSAHIGHMFMTLLGSREERAKATLLSIGPAVLNGGLSTFLAFVLLANSQSYGFVLFFRVFMTVVLFGLFHGLVYLPVILSWVGPSPYPSNIALPVGETTLTNHDSADKPKGHQNLQNDARSTNGYLKPYIYGSIPGRSISIQVEMEQNTPDPQYEQQLCDNCICNRQGPLTSKEGRADGKSVLPEDKKLELHSDRKSGVLTDEGQKLLANNRPRVLADDRPQLLTDEKPRLLADDKSGILAGDSSCPTENQPAISQGFWADGSLTQVPTDSMSQIIDKKMLKRITRHVSAQTDSSQQGVCRNLSAGASDIQYCEVCHKQCVLCTLQTAQKVMDSALTEMSNMDGPYQFCSCSSHRQLNQLRYHHHDQL